MSQSRQEEEESEAEEECHLETQEEEKALEAHGEESISGALASPAQDSNAEQAPKQESWLWNWFPFPLLSGLTWLGDRSKLPQEPVCCQLERKKASSGRMCPECEVTFCKKCQTLHYSQGFIKHGLLGHRADIQPELFSPAVSAALPRRLESCVYPKSGIGSHSAHLLFHRGNIACWTVIRDPETEVQVDGQA
ncbi:uncharacterized protein C17orf50 homolog [Sceloporus undulatus]|uniref:uncharacterized protein C17orf50 homolog n=1 Tax=Sceloporus undulatus TaxID=8520 RepID=UPI001C4B7BD6|nr:uncharacterized protein C17orf50 homolog [Sceloporus undulatus]